MALMIGGKKSTAEKIFYGALDKPLKKKVVKKESKFSKKQ
jgi:ribosomal protein S7